MTLTGSGELFRQIAFIAYYFHWQEKELLEMPHIRRRMYCEEISRINRKTNGENNIFSL